MAFLVNSLIFYFGCIIGSFLNVVILRLPQEEQLGGRSHCVHCGHVLSSFELIPLLSFAGLGGKCKSCRKPISPRYFIIEAITGLLFLISWQILAPVTLAGYLGLASSWVFLAALVAVFVVDFEHFLILDTVIYFSLAVIIVIFIALDVLHRGPMWDLHVVRGIIGACIGAAPFYLIWKLSQGTWMGFGDVKLMLLLGFFLGWPLVYVNLLIAVMLGGVVSIGLLMSGRKGMKSQIPFGTFLSIGGVVVLLWGPAILKWYLALLGF